MDHQAQCSDCRHVQARLVCGCPRSPHAGRTMAATDRCACFDLNPASVLYWEALQLVLEKDSSAVGVDLLERALTIGLPQDDELAARFSVGEGYIECIANSQEPAATKGADHPYVRRALEEIAKAAAIDRGGKYGYFAEPLNRARLEQPDCLCLLVAINVGNAQGDTAAVQFIDRTLSLFSYLPSTPLLHLLERKAEILEVSDSPAAAQFLKDLVAADPVLIADEDGKEAALRSRAAIRLMRLQDPPPMVEAVSFGRKNSAALAVFLSIVFPGGGQFYNGQVKKGLFVLFTFWLMGPYLWSWFDAYAGARRVSRSAAARVAGS